MIRIPALLLASSFAVLGALAAHAQSYPGKPVRIVVPYPPGGGADIHARLVGAKLSALLGQPVLVENRAGASGNIGADLVAKAPPDGYTLLKANTNFAIAPAFTKQIPFNIVTDFAPIATTLTSQNMLIVRTSLPAANVRELIAYARQNPGKLTYGSSGIGTPMLAMELFKMLAGVSIVHVPYKGDAPALTDLVGGQIDMYAGNLAAVDVFYRSGKVRGLAVTSKRRAGSLPNVPTMEEAGVPEYELSSWFGFLAPANTPRPIVERLHQALAAIIEMPDVRQQITQSGATPTISTPDEFGRLIRSDVEKFARIVGRSGMKVESQ